MQNNEHSKFASFGKFFQEKGYYIILFLCVLAVGISGYIFISGAVSEKNALNDASLSVVTSAQIPSSASAAASSASSGKKTSAPGAGTSSPASAASSAAAASDSGSAKAETLSVRVWPVSGTRIADYAMQSLSYNDTTQDWRTHDGVDLSALAGESVKAACSGTVTAVYDDEYLGTTVVISHPEGYMTYYSNLAAMPTVATGDRVTVGDVIGSVGQSALLESASQSHLHFAVTKNGESVDPVSFVD